MSHELNIRDATAADLAAINAIYNHYVETSTCTYQTRPSTLSEREHWFAAHGAGHPVIVAEISGEVVGWGSLSPFHAREAFRFTTENSVYVRADRHRQGIGRALLAELISRATAAGFWQMIAVISADQAGSIRLHERAGFRMAGRLERVGYKFDRWLDVVYMQRELPQPA